MAAPLIDDPVLEVTMPLRVHVGAVGAVGVDVGVDDEPQAEAASASAIRPTRTWRMARDFSERLSPVSLSEKRHYQTQN